jgi:hypothetical protein
MWFGMIHKEDITLCFTVHVTAETCTVRYPGSNLGFSIYRKVYCGDLNSLNSSFIDYKMRGSNNSLVKLLRSLNEIMHAKCILQYCYIRAQIKVQYYVLF